MRATEIMVPQTDSKQPAILVSMEKQRDRAGHANPAIKFVTIMGIVKKTMTL